VTAGQVILWRHGRTAFNHESRFQGQLDTPLDEVGQEQARQGAALLAAEIADAGPVRIVSSDLARAWSTAAALSERIGVEVTPDQRLREVYAGRWEGLTRPEISASWPDDFAAWRRGDDVRVGGGETRSEAAARAAECIRESDAATDGGTLVCVSHGAALRGAVFLLLGWSGSPWSSLEGLRNAHWARLQNLEGRWRLSGWNLGSPSRIAVPASGRAPEVTGTV
jgi:broad specificity phosphatase PhoE